MFAIVLTFLPLAPFFACTDGDFTLMWSSHAKQEEVKDKVVGITGASRGIGEILVKQFAHLGAKLILSARNEAELERVKQNLLKSAAIDVTEEALKLCKKGIKVTVIYPGSVETSYGTGAGSSVHMK